LQGHAYLDRRSVWTVIAFKGVSQRERACQGKRIWTVMDGGASKSEADPAKLGALLLLGSNGGLDVEAGFSCRQSGFLAAMFDLLVDTIEGFA
jgi:hypothetical protein